MYFLKKDLLLLYVCVYPHVCVYEYRGLGSPETGGTSGCESPGVVVGNLNRVLCKSSTCS